MMIFALCIVGTTACQEFDIDSQQWDGALKMEIDARDSYTALGTSPADIVFNISSNTPWSITSSEQWCKPTPAMSASSALTSTVTVAMESNRALEPRTATLIIKGEGIEEAKVITITQEAKNELEVVYDNKIASVAGGEITFGVISNKAWRVSTTAQFLMDMEPKSGDGRNDSSPEYVTVTLPANDGARRTGTVTIKTELNEFAFTITQDGVYLEVAENNLVIPEEGEEKIIAVNANVEWRAEVAEEYADYITAEKLSVSELKIAVKRNGSFATRTGEVKLIGEDSSLELETKIAISQTGNTGFTLAAGTTLDENGYAVVRKGDRNSIVSKFKTTTGHITFEFADINITGQANLRFNMYAGTGNQYNYFLYPGDLTKLGLVTAGGWGYQFKQHKVTAEQANAMRKLEFFVEENASMIDIRVLVDGQEVGTVSKSNVWADGQDNGKMNIYVQQTGFTDADYCTIKSISYESYE